jgi:hypothetical protein
LVRVGQGSLGRNCRAAAEIRASLEAFVGRGEGRNERKDSRFLFL